jgi:endonuclease YncB( thermonuclease family)
MKTRRAQFRVLGIVLTTLAAVGIPSAQAPDRGPATVTINGPVRVIEADTLEVSIRGTRVGVRIAGIRVPRGNTPCGREASAVVRQLLSSGAWLDEEPRLAPVARGWLRLYRVTTPTGRSVAAELAHAGLAAAEPSEADAANYPEILAGEADARNGRRGCVGSGGSGPGR